MRPFFETLSPDEKDEQLRDWALYALRSMLGLTSTEEMPMRYPALRDTLPNEVSPGRVFPITATEWGLLAAPDLLRNKPVLAGLIDRHYAACNCLPEKIHLFSYTGGASSTISITYSGSINPKDLFTSEYGYYSATISTLSDFSNFVVRIDDLVSFQQHAGSIILGGRKYLQDGRRALTLEDIAQLYQAYNPSKPSATPEVDVGFSLDSELDYAALAGDIRQFADPHSGSVSIPDDPFFALISRHRKELLAAADRLEKKHDKLPFYAMRRRYDGSTKAAEMRFHEALRRIEMRNAYQTARYNGSLQGTSVGMILFYTDLTAKLWTLDYKGAAPRSIKGFRTMDEISLPKLYWADFVRLSKTRLWFGLRQDGFEFYGDKILFQPLVTRVYAASSDPLLPGKESKPNYPSREFLGWWDKHYETLAAVEPYYHKLDQIQKWSCVLMVLKGKKSHLLDFLKTVSVRHDRDFETWMKDETTLSKITIPFLDRQKYGRTTECLPLLSSKIFPMMGSNYMLSGGVSLASWKDIQAKMNKHGKAGTETSTLSSEGQKTGRGSPPGARRSGGTPSGHTSATDGSVRQSLIASTASRNTGQKYGTFSAEQSQGTVRLKWTKGSSLAPYELVSSLAALQESDRNGAGREEIFKRISDIHSVVRVKDWNAYLIKTAVSREQWVYLAVNPVKTAEYPAKAAAAFSTADIFCAKLVSDAYAQKLAAGRPVVR